MKKAKMFWWTTLLVIAAGLGGWFLWDKLEGTRTPYEVQVQWEDEMKPKTSERSLEANFVRLSKDLEIKTRFGKVDSRKQHLTLMGREQFLARVATRDTILISLRGDAQYDNEGDGAARYYILLGGEHPLPAYREFVPNPKGTSKIKSLTHEGVIFEKNTSDISVWSMFGYVVGSLLIWVLGMFLPLTPSVPVQPLPQIEGEKTTV